ncbi:ricin-type beta-trefoil lectin domain protein [Rhodococcus fascians]|uniref:glycoside hydrolase family 16 protein n=1 Tax=Rhodococcoides fascians TaxID=1828 RepID=UPI001C5E4033|nr:glycoside hydrolase family 16 protein [Rhodococcus fascians]MBW4781526.1 ricin-type beta-trefoil lectin domain protein [Rhodococcus fascians]
MTVSGRAVLKRSLVTLGTTVLLSAFVVHAPQAAAATSGQIKTPAGFCLDNKGGLTGQNNPVQIWDCNGTGAQTWTGTEDATIRVQGRCLSPASGYAAAGVALTTWACNGKPAQQWSIRGDGSISLLQKTGLCIQNSREVNGNRPVLAKCNGSAAQKWITATTLFPTTPPTTTTPPATPPTTPSTTPSGVAAPVGDLPGWKQIFVDDFAKPSAVGSWANDCDPTKIVYVGAQNQQWRTYPKCYKDTYQKRPYRADAVLSTHDGLLDYGLHNVDGVPAGASVSPVINAAGQNQTYGRYTARFKVDSATLAEYYVAWLLWPQSERWPADGEMDFPEGSLAGQVGGFHHYSGAGSCVGGCQDVARNIGANFTDWHTYTIEWSPGRVRYILDNTVVLDSTKWVPSGPMRWELQTETNGTGNSNGHLLLDWVSVYSWVG